MIQNSLYQPIEIFMSGRNLKDQDFFSKSDPYVKVSYRRDFNCKSYTPLGRTQTISNNLNPNFARSISLDYIFQSRQDIKFEVYDDDNGNDDWIGSVETTVGALMGAKNQTSILQLKDKIDGKSTGKLIIRCQKLGQSGLHYQLKFKAHKLMNTDSFFDFWDKSDPYLKMMKIRNDNSMIEVFRTQWIKDNLNPDWKPFQIQSDRLHSQNNLRFKVQVWDWQANGKDQFIGQAYLEIDELRKANFPKEIMLMNPKSKKPGKLILERFRSFNRPTFVDYLRGGLELNMIIAVDFTASNGTPTSPNSLHYMNPNKPNQYQMAIEAVGQILLNYDSDKRIPAFGFGGNINFPKLPSGTNHCFPLSGDFDNVDSVGLPHMMQLYAQALQSVQLSGPTYFSSVIQQVGKLANSCKQNSAYIYQTLMILTDGEIHDMDKVIDLIIKCTSLPLSIIIVGIGQADFSNMVRLDGDNGLFDSKGRKAARDIVQFVPFRDVQFNPDVLAKQLLAELPTQVVQYFQNLGINPNPPKQQNIETMMMSQNPQQNQQNLTDMFQKAQFFEQPQNNNVNPYGDS